MTPKLQALDLFSGIGGFSYALRSIAKTVAYCDIDPVCRQVLTKNMENGKIDCAPIFEDVTQLQGRSIKRICKKVDLVCGGFPCQDVATMNGEKKGILGERTGLFVHIIRIVKDLPSVKYVFLENVANIFNLGLEHVLTSLEKLGFSCAYGIFQANENEVGSLHARRRCFILAYRNITTNRTGMLRCHGDIQRPWRREPSVRDRLILRKHKTDKQIHMGRYAMLGNSVVPQCVAHAWNVLVTYLSSNNTEFTFQQHHTQSSDKLFGKVFIRTKGKTQTFFRTIKLRIRSHPILLPDGAIRMAWATPQRSFVNPYFSKSSEDKIKNGCRGTKCVRGFTNLINQLFFDKETMQTFNHIPPRGLYTYYDANPQFLEWLMGYPRDWTRLDKSKRHEPNATL